MKIITGLVLFFGFCFYAMAETVIQVHTFSYHENRAANYNERNYGLALKSYVKDKQFDYVQVGGYKNSEYNTSNYVAIGYEWPVGKVTLGLKAGLITGYSMGNVLPFVVPVIKYKAVSVLFAPYPDAVVHLTIDVLTFN